MTETVNSVRYQSNNGDQFFFARPGPVSGSMRANISDMTSSGMYISIEYSSPNILVDSLSMGEVSEVPIKPMPKDIAAALEVSAGVTFFSSVTMVP